MGLCAPYNEVFVQFKRLAAFETHTTKTESDRTKGNSDMLTRRHWVPESCEQFIQDVATQVSQQDVDELDHEIRRLTDENRIIHERDCINLNPATNAMNPRAEALLAQGLGTRPSLGYPGDKYEMGLEAIERIEIIATELAAEVFGAKYAEIRVGSGALANLYVFMATAKPGESIIAPPVSIGGHITHHAPGAAGQYGVLTHPAPVDPGSYTVDIEKLRAEALSVRPKLITIGGSLNLMPHPVREIRSIADEIGAWVHYDAAHMSGLIAGKAWQQPLEEGADVMTLSTYKSFGGPPSGLILTNSPELAERLDHIAFPGLTANFDVAKAAALAMTLLDWKVHGHAYAKEMVDAAKALSNALNDGGIPVFSCHEGITTSHQFALSAPAYGGGQAAAKRLRRANILSCGIGLPEPEIEGDMNGLRMGVSELVRWGMRVNHMPEIAKFCARALLSDTAADQIASEVSAFRRHFSTVHFVR